jgi:hypothetical protein
VFGTDLNAWGFPNKIMFETRRHLHTTGKSWITVFSLNIRLSSLQGIDRSRSFDLSRISRTRAAWILHISDRPVFGHVFWKASNSVYERSPDRQALTAFRGGLPDSLMTQMSYPSWTILGDEIGAILIAIVINLTLNIPTAHNKNRAERVVCFPVLENGVSQHFRVAHRSIRAPPPPCAAVCDAGMLLCVGVSIAGALLCVRVSDAGTEAAS